MAFSSIWNEVFETLTKIINESSVPTELYFTGHSLGGALATLAAFEASYRVKDMKVKSVYMYNFGSPRVGWFLNEFSLNFH